MNAAARRLPTRSVAAAAPVRDEGGKTGRPETVTAKMRSTPRQLHTPSSVEGVFRGGLRREARSVGRSGTRPAATACRVVPACKTVDTARRRGAPPSNAERSGALRHGAARLPAPGSRRATKAGSRKAALTFYRQHDFVKDDVESYLPGPFSATGVMRESGGYFSALHFSAVAFPFRFWRGARSREAPPTAACFYDRRA